MKVMRVSLDRLDGRMDGLDGRMARLDGRMARLDDRMAALEKRTPSRIEPSYSPPSSSSTASSQKPGVLKNCVGEPGKVLPVRLPVA